jgi:hypothetical protein
VLPSGPFEGFWWFVAALVAMVAWRIWGERVVAALRRHDQRRRDADLRAYFDRMNPNAHFRQTVDQIGEATPAVEPLSPANGPRDLRAKWNGEIYATREDAEAARWRHIITQARTFYVDLDRAYGNRIRASRSSTLGDGGGGQSMH